MSHPPSNLEIEAMLLRAAEDGARRALREVGLHDEDAIHDLRELRTLLDSYRQARRTFWTGIIKALSTGFLVALLAGASIHLWNK